MTKITHQMELAYLANGGGQCPHCGSANIAAMDSLDPDGTRATRAVECLDCEEPWLDVYGLNGIAEAEAAPAPTEQELGVLIEYLKERGYLVLPTAKTPEEIAYARAARKNLYKGGEIEIDSPTCVSLGNDPGAYVLAWVWVPKDLTKLPETADEDEEWTETWKRLGDDMPCPQCGATGPEGIETHGYETRCWTCNWSADNPVARTNDAEEDEDE